MEFNHKGHQFEFHTLLDKTQWMRVCRDGEKIIVHGPAMILDLTITDDGIELVRGFRQKTRVFCMNSHVLWKWARHEDDDKIRSLEEVLKDDIERENFKVGAVGVNRDRSHTLPDSVLKIWPGIAEGLEGQHLMDAVQKYIESSKMNPDTYDHVYQGITTGGPIYQDPTIMGHGSSTRI